MAYLPRFTFALLTLALLSGPALAQDRSLGPRQLAAGVLTKVRDPNIDDAALDETREFSELLNFSKLPEWTPHFDPASETLLEKAKRVAFQREIWSLEFSFKSLRVINVEGKDVWYLIYVVRNNGEVRRATAADGKVEITGSQKPIRFVPTFILQSHDRRRAYRDRVLPEVLNRIAQKERPSGTLYDSASLGKIKIPVSTPTSDKSVWGVATWDNVDPRSDYISVFVHGLTNAYRWNPPKAGYKPGDVKEQDRVATKALQINFWRGGDSVELRDDEFHLGLPSYPDDPVRQQEVLQTYKLEKPVRYRWVYR